MTRSGDQNSGPASPGADDSAARLEGLRPDGTRLDTLLLTALDAAGELIQIRGGNGRVLYVNAAFLETFGGERGDWVGRWFSVAPPSRQQTSAATKC